MSDIERREYCLKHFLASNKAEPNIYEAFRQGWDNYKHDHGHRIKEQEAEIQVLREQLEQSTKASAAWALEAGRLEGQLRTDREAHNALVTKATAWGREAVEELENKRAELSISLNKSLRKLTKNMSVLALVYRKHHLGDDSIGWEELSDKVQIVLAEYMGDENFIKWSESFNAEEGKP